MARRVFFSFHYQRDVWRATRPLGGAWGLPWTLGGVRPLGAPSRCGAAGFGRWAPGSVET